MARMPQVRGFLLAMAVALLTATTAAAQTPPAPDAVTPTDEMTPAQVQRLFDAMLVMQAQDALGLSEQQYGPFLSRPKLLQDTRRRNQQQRARMLADLQRMTNPKNTQGSVNEAEIRSRLSALTEFETRSGGELRKAYEGLDEVLNPLQQARFRVFEEEIERRKIALVGRARQNNRQNNPLRQPPARRPPGR